eukprot:CAMPEP_0177478264 /NCGR_PEP_ID=MMETSP0369-20130122/24591_1 /TAXON_ID=447022 ORGANISM="Scrippsiella hangoei-like, Strain SHHI-4" /NCGR_SAMPLE_ID=MMETSP0369 /ASSEMBLY_ACC=CAM_ASM_000364 /LENGTH=413 /DNA_ID=CAMNT_0018953677 /DNA_START=146 /DNA_END=1387 /DNA_ORIENTATION=+
MCGYRNTDMCANLLQRGVFSAPLKYGTAPRVGKTIDSALEYCHKLLEEGGTCERTLPSTYSVWKKSSATQCRAPDYDKYVFEHPLDKREKSMLVVNYDAVKAYDRAGELNLFTVFKTIIIGIYLLAMLGECKSICSVVQWIQGFPRVDASGQVERRAGEADAGAEEKGEEEEQAISGITDRHRYTMVLLTVVRLVMLFILTWVGLMFLLKDTDYINLLLNAMGLIVVVELTEEVYAYLLSPELQEEVEDIGSLSVPFRGHSFLRDRPALKDLIVLALFIAVTIAVMVVNHNLIVNPLTDSLSCACLSQGEHCYEAHRYSTTFWDDYWTKAVPKAFKELDQLKASMAVSQLVREGDADISVLDKNELEEKSPDWFSYESLLATKSAANASTSASGRVAKRRHAKMHHDAGKLGV